ncbi:MAG: DegT/DnrJ/EryC1/StrS family aminotransferase [Magnetospirillum sp. WYHS-4]
MAALQVPFLDLRVLDEGERADLLAAMAAVLDHGRLILGPEVQELERRFAMEIGRSHAIGVGSGTDALILALKALGIGPGDEVVTTPLSFVATANAIALAGAQPVFADIGDDLNLDAGTIEPLLSERTRAILAVHWAGTICRMEAILPIAARHGLFVVEDCAQSFGATRGGRPAGSFGDVGCFSMNSMKGLASLGEAGMVATDQASLHETLRALRYNGMVDRETCKYVSHNGRLQTLQAAALLVRLDRYRARRAARRATAAYYTERLAGVVETPRSDAGAESAYSTYTIRTDRRDALKAFLAERGIESQVQHAPLMPEQAPYIGSRAHFPNARRLIGKVLCLPASEKISQAQRERVADAVLEFFGARGS